MMIEPLTEPAETLIWTNVDTGRRFSRLSHTSTLIGSYLFVLGGHDGHKYSQDLLLLNLGEPLATLAPR